MYRKYLFVLFFLIEFLISCVMDRFDYKVDYSNAKPVFFNIKVANMSDDDKLVVFERTLGNSVRTENEQFLISANCELDFENIVCIDNRFETGFRDFRPGMFGHSTISILVEEDRIEIGEFNVNCCNEKPVSYGVFISGKLAKIESGIVSLKLTIAEDGTLNLDFLNLDELMANS